MAYGIRRMRPIPLPPGSNLVEVCCFFLSFFLIYLRGSVTDFGNSLNSQNIFLCRGKSETNNGLFLLTTPLLVR